MSVSRLPRMYHERRGQTCVDAVIDGLGGGGMERRTDSGLEWWTEEDGKLENGGEQSVLSRLDDDCMMTEDT